MNRFLLLLAGLLLVTACATPPKPLRGDFASMVPDQAVQSGQLNQQVRWGGRILGVEPARDQTCFEILARPLTAAARPIQNVDTSQGRFTACRAGFYDPAIFTTERDVTVIGRIVDFQSRQIGEYEYRQPLVAADIIHLWPAPAERDYPALYASPYWPPYGMGYGWWGYPYYPPVVVRRAPAPKPPAPDKP